MRSGVASYWFSASYAVIVLRCCKVRSQIAPSHVAISRLVMKSLIIPSFNDDIRHWSWLIRLLWAYCNEFNELAAEPVKNVKNDTGLHVSFAYSLLNLIANKLDSINKQVNRWHFITHFYVHYVNSKTLHCYLNVNVRILAIANPSVVCLSSVCNVRVPYWAGLKLCVLSHFVPWPSDDLHAKFYRDRTRRTPLSEALNPREVAK